MCVRTESPLENDCRRSSTCGLSDGGRRSTSFTPASASLSAPEELGERAVHERERRVGPVPAHELGLVVDDAAVARLALAQARLRSRASASSRLLAGGDVTRRDNDAVDRRVVEQVVGDDLDVHPRAVASSAPGSRAGGTDPASTSEPSQSSTTRSRSSGCTVSKMLWPSGHVAVLVAVHPLHRGARVQRACRRRRSPRSTSEMLATSPRRRSSDARTVCSASTRSVTSRALVTMPLTAGSSRWLVATISIQRTSPSARGEAVANRLGRPAGRAAAVRTAPRAPGDPPRTSP